MGLGFLYGGSSFASTAVVGVGIRLLDHLLFSLSWGFLSFGFITIRVLLRLPGEFFFW